MRGSARLWPRLVRGAGVGSSQLGRLLRRFYVRSRWMEERTHKSPYNMHQPLFGWGIRECATQIA